MSHRGFAFAALASTGLGWGGAAVLAAWVVLVVIAVCCFHKSRMRIGAPARLAGAVNGLIVCLSQRALRSAARRRHASPNAWKILK